MGLITTVFILACCGEIVSLEGNVFIGGLNMRFVSKLAMAVAAIFFALSVSAHAGGHDTTGNGIGSKVYQVCKKWRVDQGGWLATERMQECRNVLFCTSVVESGFQYGCTEHADGFQSDVVDANARDVAKACLQGTGSCYDTGL